MGEQPKEPVNLGLRFTQLRHDKGLSQAGLAKLIGVDPSTICNWEHKRKMEQFESFCRALHILNATPEYFFNFEIDPPRTPSD